jgi:6-phosphofructokinase 1
VGVPKTIDNDIVGTTSCFGFDTAVAFATDAIDRLHTTAEAHRRILVVEVMGRYAGWIALNAGISGGADVILIPEIPFDIESVCAKIREREKRGRHFSMVVVAEGATPKGGHRVLKGAATKGGGMERLGGIAQQVAEGISERTGKESRSLILGHLQRGGSPTTFDRLLSLRFGAAAIRCVAAGQFGVMVALQPPTIGAVPLAEALAKPKLVPLDSDSVLTARDIGICLGD